MNFNETNFNVACYKISKYFYILFHGMSLDNALGGILLKSVHKF